MINVHIYCVKNVTKSNCGIISQSPSQGSIGARTDGPVFKGPPRGALPKGGPDPTEGGGGLVPRVGVIGVEPTPFRLKAYNSTI